MTDGFRLQWHRQNNDLGLILKDFNDQAPRVTLIAIGDAALSGEKVDEVENLLRLLLGYHGRLRQDPAWITIVGAAMLPLPVIATAERTLRSLLRGMANLSPPLYGPWWDVTMERTAHLRHQPDHILEQILIWPADPAAGSVPLGWQAGAGSHILTNPTDPGRRLAGPDGWRDQLRRRFRGVPVPLASEHMLVRIEGPDAGRVILAPEVVATRGAKRSATATRTEITLPSARQQRLLPGMRLAILPDAGPLEPAMLDAGTRLLALK